MLSKLTIVQRVSGEWVIVIGAGRYYGELGGGCFREQANKIVSACSVTQLKVVAYPVGLWHGVVEQLEQCGLAVEMLSLDEFKQIRGH